MMRVGWNTHKDGNNYVATVYRFEYGLGETVIARKTFDSRAKATLWAKQQAGAYRRANKVAA